MNFIEIATNRQSCRNYDSTRPVEEQKIRAILDAAILSPSACNGQPYHFTVLTGKKAKSVAKATISMGLNKFSLDAPVIIVISLKLEAIYPIAGRFCRSRSPPQPNTVIILLCGIAERVDSTFFKASGVCA